MLAAVRLIGLGFLLATTIGLGRAGAAVAPPATIDLVENGAVTKADAAAPSNPRGWTRHRAPVGMPVLSWTPGDGGFGALVIGADHAVDAGWFQEISVQPGRWYRISGFLRMADVVGGNGAVLGRLDPVLDGSPTPGRHGDVPWTAVTHWVHTSSSEHELRVGCRLGGSGALSRGQVWCTRIRVEPSGGPPTDDGPFFPNGTLASFLLVILIALAIRAYGRLGDTAPKNETRQFAYVLLAISVTKIAVAPLLSHVGDASIYGGWARQLAEQGLDRLYAPGFFSDYPPTYMYPLWWIGLVREKLDLGPHSAELLVLLKTPAILADAAIGWLLFARLRPTDRRLAWTAALAFSLNPALWLNSTLWGQTDSVLTLLLLIAFLAQGRRQFETAWIFVALAVLMKPQALLLAVLLPFWPHGWWKSARPLSCAFAAGTTVFVLADPFRGPRPWSFLTDIYATTMGFYPETSVNAMNLPALLFGMRQDDLVPVLGATPNTWGLVVGLAFGALFLLAYVRRPDRAGYVTFLAAAMLVSFVCLTRMHERYLYPFFVFAALIGVTGRVGIVYWGLSGVLLLNQVSVLRWADHTPPWVWQTGAAMNCVLLLGWLWLDWQMSRARLEPPGAPALARDDAETRTGRDDSGRAARTTLAIVAASSLCLASSSTAAAEAIPAPPNDDLTVKAPNAFHPEDWRREGYRIEPGAAELEWHRDSLGFRVLTLASRIPNDLRWVREVPVVPNTWYRVAAWLRAEGVDGPASHAAHLWIPGTELRSRGVEGDSSWVPVSIWVRTGSEQTSLEVACRLGRRRRLNSGTARCAGLTVEPSTRPPIEHGFSVEPSYPTPFESRAPALQFLALAAAIAALIAAWRARA